MIFKSASSILPKIIYFDSLSNSGSLLGALILYTIWSNRESPVTVILSSETNFTKIFFKPYQQQLFTYIS